MDEFGRRKVRYRLTDETGFDPTLTEEEHRQQELNFQEKVGWWHTWTQVLEQDPQSGNLIVVANGVIEAQNGLLYELPPRWFKFIDNE